jgi:superfamily II DNA helicase RecQ
VRAVLEGRDVLAVMPTGSGKSLGFQLPPVLLRGTTIVVSPLIALMKDQVDELTRRGIRAAAVHSLISDLARGVPLSTQPALRPCSSCTSPRSGSPRRHSCACSSI